MALGDQVLISKYSFRSRLNSIRYTFSVITMEP